MATNQLIPTMEAAAAEFSRLQIPYKRVAAEIFELPVAYEGGAAVVFLRATEEKLQAVAPNLLTLETPEEYKAVAMLNFHVVTFGRLGVDPADGELRFDGEQYTPSAADVVVAYARSSSHVRFALQVLQRVRFGSLSALAALDAAQADAARRRAVREAYAVAEAAWGGGTPA